MIWVFVNSPGDRVSIPGRVIPKTQKIELDAWCIIRYRSMVKRSNLRKGVAPLPTPWCSSLWKGSLQITLDYGRPTLLNWAFGLMCGVFVNGPGDRASISGWVIPKTQKIVLDASLFNNQHHKIRIKGKLEQSEERSSTFPYTLL